MTFPEASTSILTAAKNSAARAKREARRKTARASYRRMMQDPVRLEKYRLRVERNRAAKNARVRERRKLNPRKRNPNVKCGAPEYSVYHGMKQRCLNAKGSCYYLYGGRGIKVSDEWLYSFDNFIRDMGPRPSPNHSIDRIDPNGHYSKENCRWATTKEQSLNKRTSVVFHFNGKSMHAKAWAKELDIGIVTFYRRLKLGYPAEKVFAPSSLNPKFITYKGETHTLTGWDKKLGRTIGITKFRMEKGWSVEDNIEKPVKKLIQKRKKVEVID